MSAGPGSQDKSTSSSRERFEKEYERLRNAGYTFKSGRAFIRFLIPLCVLLAGLKLVVRDTNKRRMCKHPPWIKRTGWDGLQIVLHATTAPPLRGFDSDIILLEEPAYIDPRVLEEVILPEMPPRKKQHTLFIP